MRRPESSADGARRAAAQVLASASRLQRPYINLSWSAHSTAVAAGFFDINVLGDADLDRTLAALRSVCLSVICLRRSAPNLPRGFSVPFYPVLPVLGITVTSTSSPFPWDVLQFFLWYMLGGVVLYFVYGMRHSNLQHGEAAEIIQRTSPRLSRRRGRLAVSRSSIETGAKEGRLRPRFSLNDYSGLLALAIGEASLAV